MIIKIVKTNISEKNITYLLENNVVIHEKDKVKNNYFWKEELNGQWLDICYKPIYEVSKFDLKGNPYEFELIGFEILK